MVNGPRHSTQFFDIRLQALNAGMHAAARRLVGGGVAKSTGGGGARRREGLINIIGISDYAHIIRSKIRE